MIAVFTIWLKKNEVKDPNEKSLASPPAKYVPNQIELNGGLNGLRFLSATSSNFLTPRHISLHMRMMFPELFEENDKEKKIKLFSYQ